MRNEAIHHFCQTLPGQINQAQGLSSNRSALNSLSGSYSDLLAPKMHRGAQATPSHNNLIVTKKTMIIGIIKYNFSVYQGQTCLGVICTRTNISTTGNFQWFNNRAGADGGNILFLYPKLYKTRCFLIALPSMCKQRGWGFPLSVGTFLGLCMVCPWCASHSCGRSCSQSYPAHPSWLLSSRQQNAALSCAHRPCSYNPHNPVVHRLHLWSRSFSVCLK